MRRVLPAILITGSLCVSGTLSGCAALMSRGPSQLDVAVEDPQEQVDVLIASSSGDQTIRRKVPFFTVGLDRHSDYTLSVRSPGYRPYETTIKRQAQPHVWGDLILLGVGTVGITYAATHPGATVDGLWGVPVMTLGAGLATAGLFGLGWGTVTGTLWSHSPSSLVVTLEKEPKRPFWPFW